MKRWFALFLLLASCSGCMLFEEDRYYGPVYDYSAQPANSCGVPTVTNISQTIEPPR